MDIENRTEHEMHLQKSSCDEDKCKEIEGLTGEEIERLKAMKRPTWDTIFTAVIPGAAMIPDPCKYLTPPMSCIAGSKIHCSDNVTGFVQVDEKANTQRAKDEKELDKMVK